MEGFKIRYNDACIEIAVQEDTLLLIDISELEGRGNFYVGGCNYTKQEKFSWYDNVQISIGDTFQIDFIDVNADKITTPNTIIHDKNLKSNSSISKIELFEKMELELKKRGLI